MLNYSNMTKINLSLRALNYPTSTIRGLTGYALAAEKTGVEVISLNLGAPDLPTPNQVREQGIKFLRQTQAVRYGPSGGDPNLIVQLVTYYRERLKLPAVRAENLLITQGASEALELVMYTVADPGDAILTPDPCYANYGAIAYKYGLHLRPLPTHLGNGFHLLKKGESISQAVARLGRQVNRRTKAILWSSPGNPTGTVYTSDELKVLLELSRHYNLYLIADEVYRLLTFAGEVNSPIPRAPSILDVAKASDRERLIVLDSASKMISFCGGRIGIVTASPDLIANLTNQASVRGCAGTISQAAVSAISGVPASYFAHSRSEFLARRDFLHQGLLSLKDLGLTVSPHPPEGAFYLVADLGHNLVAADYCRWLLTDYLAKYGVKTSLFLTPMRMGAGGFYLSSKKGTSEVRLAYVLEKPKLQRALSVLRHSLPIYQTIRKDRS